MPKITVKKPTPFKGKITVNQAAPSFPRTIPGRSRGERGLQTSLSVVKGKESKVNISVR